MASLGSNDGRPMTVDGVVYAKGLGVHAYTDIRGACSTLSAIIGLDDWSVSAAKSHSRYGRTAHFAITAAS